MASKNTKSMGNRGGGRTRDSEFKKLKRNIASDGWLAEQVARYRPDVFQRSNRGLDTVQGRKPDAPVQGNNELDKWLMHQGFGVPSSQWPGPVPKDGYELHYLGNDAGTPEGQQGPLMPYYEEQVIKEAMRPKGRKNKRPRQDKR